MMPDAVILSWSGGKDSALALHALSQDPRWRVAGLLTSVTRGFDRVSMHGVRRSLLDLQARRLGLPLFVVDVEQRSDNASYESAFHAALGCLRREQPGTRHLAFGDLFLEDVRAYRERLLSGSGFTPVFPIWGIETARLARQFIDDGFQARLVCVDTTQLDARFAGRAFDAALLAELPDEVDPCGERGEFHTFVSDGPPFSAAVAYTIGDTVLRDDRFSFCDLVSP